ncbi:TPA: DUF3265 domain-containing protein [Vibrio parahaemolyticus]|nr:DUF3265 domain-containing protein [Vibrio parahaemolyticus]
MFKSDSAHAAFLPCVGVKVVCGSFRIACLTP